ncbi:MAG: hypothetical protein ABIV48_05010 [Pyrinomonadaceae bacterium]
MNDLTKQDLWTNRIESLLAVVLLFGFLFLTMPLSISAQELQIELAPPPLTLISKDEVTLLINKSDDIKDRTKLSLKLMDDRLKIAESMSSNENFDGMFRELGVFQGVMEDALHFLHKQDKRRGKVLDNFKRLEIGLRGFAPRIAVIRRELPLRYDAYVRKLMGYLRNARAQATETLFGDTVLPERKAGNTKPL